MDPCNNYNDCDNDDLAQCVGDPFNPSEYQCVCPSVGKIQSIWDPTEMKCKLPDGGEYI
jgi:hypothetical protein